MTVKFNVKLSSEDMYRFNMYHAYTSMQGILSLVMDLCNRGDRAFRKSARHPSCPALSFDRVDLSVICAFDAAHPLEATDSYVRCFEGCPAF